MAIMSRFTLLLVLVSLSACGGSGDSAPVMTIDPLPAGSSAFVNWEHLSVHPVDVTPDGAWLLVCNTAAARLELFDITGATPVWVAAIPVGLDPVSVRARTSQEAWVCNHVSDSISVVDLTTRHVRATIATDDEPADVVFAGTPARAYVTCSQVNRVHVYNLGDLAQAPVVIQIAGEDPRALAVSADGTQVYAAIFESGNGTTVLGGGASAAVGMTLGFPPNAVNDVAGPYGGVNPPPNNGAVFAPLQRPGNPTPPAVAMIVRLDNDGEWCDDTGTEWTAMVTGADAARSGRRPGWTLPDRDLAIIDTATNAVTYAARCMNIGAALAVQPGTGRVTMVGTDATNEMRFEPNVNGRFLRVCAASIDPAALTRTVTDLNGHLDYTTATVPQSERDQSIGDPRGIAWNAAGTRAFVTGMGSNNVVVLDETLARVGRVEVGEGPTGVVLSTDGARAFVLNRFAGSVSVVDTVALTESARVPFLDPTPAAVRNGRRHLYDTHKTSGLGHTSCASCHVDARIDRLAWDLGDPAGEVKTLNQNCITDLVAPCEDFHPMKGPMLTQTLRDIVGKEPHHWRGDRDGIEEFNGAFVSLLGDDVGLTASEMQEFEDFLATIVFPPNPFRNVDNSLPTALDLAGHFTPGRFGPEGLPLPAGNAQRGLDLYRNDDLDGGVPGFECVTCHTLPTGMGPDVSVLGAGPTPAGPNGERHHSLVSVDGSTNVSLKIPQLRNLYERVGFELTQLESLSGFGFIHDGSVDSIARFISEPVFDVKSVQDIADLTAFMLAFSGSELPVGGGRLNEPRGPLSNDTHAAVGVQVTFGATGNGTLLDTLFALADAGAIDLIAKSPTRGFFYDRVAANFLTDRNGETMSVGAVRALGRAGTEVTFTAVPRGTGIRIGIDADADGFGDETERDEATDPNDPASKP